MKNIKKLSALVLALIMVLSLTATAFAATTELSGGEVGGFNPGHVDDPQVQDKTVNIQKAIIAYNPDETLIYGPVITYTYSIAPAANSGGVNELVSITDEAADHTSGVATVFDPVLAGVGTPGLTGQDNDGTTTNAIRWLNTDILEAATVASGGAANIKNLTVDFSSIVFTQPGVYRYKITESTNYANTGVTDGDISNVRYLDVYVKRSSNFMQVDTNADSAITMDDNVANWWDIYGYVCISPQSVATDAGGTTAVTPSTRKTNGFVTETVPDPSNTSATVTNKADEYYTYNFTVTKDLVGDNTMINHEFPLTVAFSGGPTGNFQLIAEKNAPATLATVGNAAGSSVNGTAVAADALQKVGSAGPLASFANAGSPKVGDGNTNTGTTTGYIKYIGIPYTTAVSVTEQNDVVGTTYTASVKEDVTTAPGTSLVPVDVSSVADGATLQDADPDVASLPYNSKATRSAAITTANSSHMNAAVQFTNNLAIISPTGVAFRVAPYVLMLATGMFLLLVSRHRRKDEEEYAMA